MIQDGNTLHYPPPKILGRYRLLRRIGRGGMGEVWLAEDPSLRRHVAIKTLPTHSQHDLAYVQRFTREARAIATLNHPHILSIHDYGEQEQANGSVLPYIVMPYITGGSLADRMSRDERDTRPLPFPEAIHYLLQAADAIDYAHTHAIIHRDIKPGNMLLRDDNWLLLTDFGIAHIISATDQVTHSGVGFGTPDYMAPEQARGQAELASDIYSLAVIAYQLLAGRLPFGGETSYATIVQHMTMEVPSPRQFNPLIPSAAEVVLLRGLAREPGDRPASAQAFVRELEQVFARSPYEPTIFAGMVPTTIPAPGNPQKSATLLTRRNILLGSGVGLIMVGGGLATWIGTKLAQPPNMPTPPATPSLGSTARPFVLQGHNQPVGSLAWSPQGQVLASAGTQSDGQVFLWDMQQMLNNGSNIALHKARQAFSTGVYMQLAWSPDGKALAIAPTSTGSFEQPVAHIAVYNADLDTFASGYNDQFSVAGNFYGLTWIEGNYLVVCSDIGNLTIDQDGNFSGATKNVLTIWKINQLLATLPLNAIVTPNIELFASKLLAFNTIRALPGTTTLAISTTNGVLIGDVLLTPGVQWNARPLLQFDPSAASNEAGVVTASSSGHTVGAIQTSSTDQVEAVTPYPDPGPRQLSIGIPLLSLTGHTDVVYDATWDPTGRYLATGGNDTNLMLWDIKTLLRQGDSSFLTVSDPLHIWKFNYSLLYGNIAWSPDGRTLAIAEGPTLLDPFNVSANKVILGDTSSSTEVLQCMYLAWQPGTDVVAAALSITGTIHDTDLINVGLWSREEPGKIRKILNYTGPRQQYTEAYTLDWSRDGRWIATYIANSTTADTIGNTSQDNRIVVWEAATGQVKSSFQLPVSQALVELQHSVPLAWSPIDPAILALGNLEHISIWDVQKSRPVLTLSVSDPYQGSPTPVNITNFTWSPNGRYLAACYGYSSRIYIWDIQNLRKTGIAPDTAQSATLLFPPPHEAGHDKEISNLAWSPDGRYIASTSLDRTVIIWLVDAL